MGAILLALGPLLPSILRGSLEIEKLIHSIWAFREKYPEMTADQIHTLVVAVTTNENDPGFKDFIARIAADQAAHPPA